MDLNLCKPTKKTLNLTRQKEILTTNFILFPEKWLAVSPAARMESTGKYCSLKYAVHFITLKNYIVHKLPTLHILLE